MIVESEDEKTWELVTNETYFNTRRLRVQEGWLYRVYDSWSGQFTTTFVPEEF